MDFNLSMEQQMMADTALQISARFDPEYWREKDESGEYPAEFIAEIGEQGFFGLPVPEQYGGMGLGLTELAVAMEALCRGGGGGLPSRGLAELDFNLLPAPILSKPLMQESTSCEH